MDDFKLVEEFLSKKNLDGVDKFLLDKYMGAIRNVLNDSIPKQKLRDKIEELRKDKRFYECFPEDYMAEICINILKELLESEE